MAEQRAISDFFIIIIGIVNNQIASFDQFKNCFIRLVRQVASIADIAKRLAAIFDAVSGGTAGIVKRCRPDKDTLARFKRVAGDKIAPCLEATNRTERNREQRRNHEIA